MKSLSRLEHALTFIMPHPRTHERAKLLHWHYLIIYLLLFMLLRVGIDVVRIYQPGVLGVASNITVIEVISATNAERQKLGLLPLKENSELDAAAAAKAQNMFSENYWAHFSPSGKTPWLFINNSGYKFSYAGENLAKNFYTTSDLIRAWMNSPTHRENIVNSRYEDIGIAVASGVLQGQETTLVVQMFGKSTTAVAASSPSREGEPMVEAEIPRVINPANTAGVKLASNKVLVDPYSLEKSAGILIISVITFLLLTDLLVLKKRGVFRLSSHHIAHLGFLAIAGAGVLGIKIGEIL